MEFHVSRQSRDRYAFDQGLFAFNGNVIFTNFQGARQFAQKMNEQRDLIAHPERAVRAGEINAMGLIDEILHAVVAQYRKERNPQAMELALKWVKEQAGSNKVARALTQFASEFPPLAVYRGEISIDDYMTGSTSGTPNDQILLEEMLMLWLANKNPAFSPFEELFDDRRLSLESAYPRILAEMHRFFATQPHFGPDNQNLIDLLRAPALAFPHSLFAQLEFILERWSSFLEGVLGEYLRRLTSSIDLIREENTQRGFTGPGPIEVPTYDSAAREVEIEAFSQDTEWMPRLVLIAKNTYVWLNQLSQVYNRRIARLDQIPDEELEQLSRRGFSGLWLIGLWERSRASAAIKQLMGNPEAIASAYSLYEYRIADDLGGEEAYRGLRDKAWRFGIRLASDMVPNHMGIDSPWVVEHPEWFLSLDYSPFPSYGFNGPDLCEDWRATVQIEDHYFDKSDAAVVFRHIDRRNNDQTRFIYHGNDGTSMPWNDTAQLDYLKAEVREAVIQVILDVARRFPIIRFDAAMTLAKEHIQRLWFPAPGAAGAIPSRSEFGMSKEQFDQIMPVEFWREVVDRVAAEAPDTLLLAEAFWMMEGYFVRTLGMHRVYNSAFMNILRDEDNAKYRLIMKNTLEFDPEILKRYVNFMNNPDERTAVDQFGKGDKYFGICMLMATMPGLPMFGHGQVEGYSEKYGMEFKRAYWNEQPDPWLIDRHSREIFPVLHRRALFAGVEHFLLYDFFAGDSVDENVYAYSNGQGSERALVIYNNRYGDTQGWIRTSTGFSVKGSGGERSITQRTLGEGLNLRGGADSFVIFRDQVTNLEYIRPSLDVINNGMFFALHAYSYHCFLDFREVPDDTQGSYRRINEFLSGRGVPSVRSALHELKLQPVLEPLREIVHPGYMRYLLDAQLSDKEAILPTGLVEEARAKLTRLISGIEQMAGPLNGQPQASTRLLDDLNQGLRLALSLPTFAAHYPMPGSLRYEKAAEYLAKGPGTASERVEDPLLFSYLFLHNLGRLADERDFEATSAAWFEEWQFSGLLLETARQMGVEEGKTAGLNSMMLLLINQQRWFERLGSKRPEEIVEAWLANLDVQDYLQVHRYKEVLWFNKERFDSFLWWMVMLAVLDAVSGPKGSASLVVERLLLTYRLVEKIQAAEEQSEYQIVKLLKALQQG